MTQDQIVIFGLLLVIFALLIWGRWRYDVIAFLALLVAVIAGLVPVDQAFLGFGHPATVVIAMVLIVSRGLSNSGAVDLLARTVIGLAKSLFSHIFLMSGLAAALSAVMNNVGALALLMPVDVQAAKRAKRAPSLTLMPLSFATILGGLVTLIGTPPNIIVAAFRRDAVGESFAMFDFTPVGGACAVAGVLFVALVGWRLLPRERAGGTQETFDLESYIAEARVPEGSSIIGKKVSELDEAAEEHDANVMGLIRRGRRLPGLARRAEIRKGDVLVLQAGPEDLERFISDLGLEHAAVTEKAKSGLLATEDSAVAEVVVQPGSRIVGRSTMGLRLKYRFGVHLLGLSRQGRPVRERLRHIQIRPGDVLLLHGDANELPDVINWLGCLPLAGRGIQTAVRGNAWICIGIFALAIILASAGLLYLPVALAAAALAMVLLNIVPLRQVYETVEWPVIVLLGSMIPIGTALEETGGTALIAESILHLAEGFPPVVVLALLMVVTMTLSDVINNTATTVIAAPIALDLARRLEVSADPFLMTVAVAASCAFLTPIGHKNNTLILGPGGYHFGDYWRMGLPLEILVIAVGLPMILWVWPF